MMSRGLGVVVRAILIAGCVFVFNANTARCWAQEPPGKLALPEEVKRLIDQHRQTVDQIRVCYFEVAKSSAQSSITRHRQVWSGLQGIRQISEFNSPETDAGPASHKFTDEYTDFASLTTSYITSYIPHGDRMSMDGITPCAQKGISCSQGPASLANAIYPLGEILVANFFVSLDTEFIDDLLRRFETAEYLGRTEVDGEPCASVRLMSAEHGAMELYFAVNKWFLIKRVVVRTLKYTEQRNTEEYTDLGEGRWFPKRVQVRVLQGNGDWRNGAKYEISNATLDLDKIPNDGDERFGFRFPKYATVAIILPGQTGSGPQKADLVVMGENETVLFRAGDMFELDRWCRDNGFPGFSGFPDTRPAQDRQNWMIPGIATAISLAIIGLLVRYIRRKRKGIGHGVAN